MNQVITQHFQVQIFKLGTEGNPDVAVAHNLASQIISWEREASDEQDDDEDQGFLVTGDESHTIDDDEDQDIEDSDEEDEDEDQDDSIGTLRLTTTLNALALAEFKAMNEDTENEYAIHFVYGGVLAKVFDINPDGWISLNEGAQPTDPRNPLMVTMNFDIYDVDLQY